MKPYFLLCICSLSIGLCGCRSTNRPPLHDPGKRAFYQCLQCESLEGGIYDFGPVKQFYSPFAKECVHRWQQISADEFRRNASVWHGYHWKLDQKFLQAMADYEEAPVVVPEAGSVTIRPKEQLKRPDTRKMDDPFFF